MHPSLSLRRTLCAIASICTLSHALILLPRGSGPFSVNVTHSELVDTARPDPYNSTQRRRLMVSRSSPVPADQCEETLEPLLTPYLSSKLSQVAPPLRYLDDKLDEFRLQQCSNSVAFEPKKYPVALFGHGLGGSRYYYQTIVQELASHGYTVASIDHPYDANAVEFPNGDVIPGDKISAGSPNFTAQLDFGVEVRARDLSFVLSELSAEAGEHLQATAWGHSFGGAAVLAVMRNDSRFVGGVSLDGPAFGPVLQEGIAQGAYFLFGASNDRRGETTGIVDKFPRWDELDESSRDREQVRFLGEASLLDSGHQSYIDFPIWLDEAGVRDQLSEEELSLITMGTISGRDILSAVSLYVRTAFDIARGCSGDKQIFVTPPAGVPVEIIRTPH